MQLNQNLVATVNAKLDQLLSSHPKNPISVAVSGGGDSMALLSLVIQWACVKGRKVRAVSVDHGLRPEAPAELQLVSDFCKKHNIAHSILEWSGPQETGNLQDQARMARRSLIGKWATDIGISTVLIGHTRDDQAETFLMRLARGSGVDGLSAMYEQEEFNGVFWLRPLLETARSDLREYLTDQKIDWAEDPSNEDERFDRVKFRNASRELTKLGLDIKTLSDTANRLKNARKALEMSTLALAKASATVSDVGTVSLNTELFRDAALELQQRLLAHSLCWISGQPYRPRIDSLNRALQSVLEGKTATVHGCVLARVSANAFEVCREPNAVATHRVESEATAVLFDGRWVAETNHIGSDLVWRALGEAGLATFPIWRESDYSRWALLGSPSLWQKDQLIAAPFVVTSDTCKVSLKPDAENFFSSIVTH